MNTLMIICNGGIFFNDPLEDIIYIHCLVSFALASIFIIFGLKEFVKGCVEDHCWWKSVAKALLVILAIALGPVTIILAIVGFIIVKAITGIIEGIKEAKQELESTKN